MTNAPLPSAHSALPTLRVTRGSAATVAADALVIGAVPDAGSAYLRSRGWPFEGSTVPDAGAVSLAAPALAEPDFVRASRAQVALTLWRRLATLAGATSELDSVRVVPAGTSAAAAVLVTSGLGDFDAPAPQGTTVRPDRAERLRRAAATGVRAVTGTAGEVVLALPVQDATDLEAVLTGAALGAYRFTRYRAAAGPVPTLVALIPDHLSDADAERTLARSAIVLREVYRVRDWVNTAPNHKRPVTFADEIAAAAAPLGIEVEVLDEQALAEQGFGGIIAIGQGSEVPPRLVRLAYRPANAALHLAIVSKGITFDTGGLSIKTGGGMRTMKLDMAGAAAAVGATIAAAELGLPIALTTYACIAENMPSGSAVRPSDVVTMYGGKTVEVNNTDAEGRVVMADGLVRAQEDQPDVLIDVATLTGASIMALGDRCAAVFTSDDALAATVKAAGAAAGEPFWQLPLVPELGASLASPIADLMNISGPFGGAITAAEFLRAFVDPELPYAHLDIAGRELFERPTSGYLETGATGFGVRSLLALFDGLVTARAAA